MSNFTDKEIAYLNEQRLGRLATVNAEGDPHVIPVVYRYNAELDTIDIAGYNMSASKKFKDIQRRGRVAFVVDDVLPPWNARGIEIRGQAQAILGDQIDLEARQDNSLIRIVAEHIVAWGLDTQAYQRNSRKVARQ